MFVIEFEGLSFIFGECIRWKGEVILRSCFLIFSWFFGLLEVFFFGFFVSCLKIKLGLADVKEIFRTGF